MTMTNVHVKARKSPYPDQENIQVEVLSFV